MCATVIRNNTLVIIKHGIASGVTDLEMDAGERCEGVEASCECWSWKANTACSGTVLSASRC